MSDVLFEKVARAIDRADFEYLDALDIYNPNTALCEHDRYVARAAIAAYEAEVWERIDRAPTDGSVILVWDRLQSTYHRVEAHEDCFSGGVLFRRPTATLSHWRRDITGPAIEGER